MTTPPLALSLRGHEFPADLNAHDRVIEAFIALELIGGSGLLVILITALFGPSVKRYSTWYSFTASWVFSCISYSLLFFAGQQTEEEPDRSLCTIQGALIYAAPTLTASTTLALVVHMLLNIRRLLTNAPFKTGSFVVSALLIVPYLVWFAMFVGILLYGMLSPETVRRSLNGTYCDSTNSSLSKISSLVVVCCTVLIVVVQGIVGLRLYRNRAILSESGQSITMAIRVMIFSLLGALALGVAVAYVITWRHDQTFDMILASLPVLAAMIFGSQLDLVRVWMFWRRNPTSNRAIPTPLTSQYTSVSSNDLT